MLVDYRHEAGESFPIIEFRFWQIANMLASTWNQLCDSRVFLGTAKDSAATCSTHLATLPDRGVRIVKQRLPLLGRLYFSEGAGDGNPLDFAIGPFWARQS
jgi:hypothetical protein